MQANRGESKEETQVRAGSHEANSQKTDDLHRDFHLRAYVLPPLGKSDNGTNHVVPVSTLIVREIIENIARYFVVEDFCRELNSQRV